MRGRSRVCVRHQAVKHGYNRPPMPSPPPPSCCATWCRLHRARAAPTTWPSSQATRAWWRFRARRGCCPSLRHHPAHAARPIRRQVPDDLDARWLSGRVDKQASRDAAAGSAENRRTGTSAPAMRYGRPAIGTRLYEPGPRASARAGAAAVPGAAGHHHPPAWWTTWPPGRRQRHFPNCFVNDYHDDPGYVASLAASVRVRGSARAIKLVMNFHGMQAQRAPAGRPMPTSAAPPRHLLAGAGRSARAVPAHVPVALRQARWLEPYTETRWWRWPRPARAAWT